MRHRADPPDPATRPRLRVGIGAVVVLLVAAFVVAVLVAAVSGGGGGPAPLVSPVSSSRPVSPVPTPSASSVYVHVSGAVRKPGLVTLTAGARIVDAVTAAGGLADDADPDGVNLARPVQDGEQVRVPRVGEPVAAAPGVDPPSTVVNLNTAAQSDLEALPRIGPALAQRILEWRTANGRFGTVEDLLQVAGIGQKVFDGLKDRVTV